MDFLKRTKFLPKAVFLQLGIIPFGKENKNVFNKQTIQKLRESSQEGSHTINHIQGIEMIDYKLQLHSHYTLNSVSFSQIRELESWSTTVGPVSVKLEIIYTSISEQFLPPQWRKNGPLPNSRECVFPAKIAREAFFETNNDTDGWPFLQVHLWICSAQQLFCNTVNCTGNSHLSFRDFLFHSCCFVASLVVQILSRNAWSETNMRSALVAYITTWIPFSSQNVI